MVEVLWIIDEDLHRLEEWNESGSVSISMIPCAYSRHEMTNLNLVIVLSVDEGSLCDSTCADESHLLKRRAKWGKRRVKSHGPNVGQNDMTPRLSVQSERRERVSACDT